MRIRCVSGLAVSAALHGLVLASLAWLTSSGRVQAIQNTGASAPTVVLLQPPEGLMDRAVDSDEPNGATLDPADLGIQLPDGASTVSVPGFTFDFAKVVGRAASLFPFLTRDVMHELAGANAPNEGRTILANPLAQRPALEAAGPALFLTDSQIQSITDEAWSRWDRWRAFRRIVELAGTHNPDDGRLPALLRAYVDQNLLQPFVDTSAPDPRFWAHLSVAADHDDFVTFILGYASRHPSTKARTELLFLLDKLAQASLEAVASLIETDPEELRQTRDAHPKAYDAIVAIRTHYLAQLERLGLTRGAFRRHYDEVRLTTLTSILRTTPDGYRTSDARFLIGAIHWRQGRTADAVRTWADMTIVPDDSYVTAYAELLAVIPPRQSEVDTRKIDQILQREHVRWLGFSYQRLRQFGYQFDTF